MKCSIECFCVSHTGKVRRINQDNFFFLGEHMASDNNGSNGVIKGVVSNESSPVFAIFDGMGGEECGEMAAYIAAKQLSDYKFESDAQSDLTKFCKQANEEICKYTSENNITTMGTTAAMLMFTKKKVFLCNIGDSKIFRWSNNSLEQISYDHVSVSAFGTKPPLTQNLGIREDELIISPYIATGEYHNKDIYLICSDGLTDMVSNDEISEILKNTDRETAAEALLRKALDGGGKDNITLILLFANKSKNNFIKKIMKSMRCGHGNNQH